MLVMLDSGPLGMLSNAAPSSDVALEWAVALVSAGGVLVVPELADFEVRRELLRADKVAGVARLDDLAVSFRYEPISTTAMHRAAGFWASARRVGQPTAPDHGLDGDVILAGQAAALAPERVIVATTNTKHLGRYVDARPWSEIGPEDVS